MPINGLTPISQTPKWIPDANQWTYTNLTKQTKHGYQRPINGLILVSQSKETRIPDANQWTYTSLQGMIIGNNCQ
jgi:hypothetical protein